MPHNADISPHSQSRESHRHRSSRLREVWNKSGKKVDEAKCGRMSFRSRLFAANSRPTDPGGGEEMRVSSNSTDKVLCDISTLCPPPHTPNIYLASETNNPPRSAPLTWLADDEGWITGPQLSVTTQASYTWSHPLGPSQAAPPTSQALQTAIGDEDGHPDPPPNYVQSQEEARRRSWPCSHPYDYWSSWSTTQQHH